MATHILAGSERLPLAGARPAGAADPKERLEVSVLVRRRQAGLLAARLAKLGAADGGGDSGRVTREQFDQEFGADPADIAKVRAFAAAHGLAVVQEDASRRTVVLAGTVAQFDAAFGVQLQNFDHPDGSYRGRTGPIQLPADLQDIVVAVLGLDNRPQASPRFRQRLPAGNVRWDSRATAPTSFTPTQLATLYDFPAGTGSGQCIAIVELGGGYRPADLTAYFGKLGIQPPTVTTVSVDHGKNQPTGDANGPDGEVMLDIEVAGAVAPGARIAVYFAPNTDAGFLDAVTTAVHDTKNKPSVVSISWGGPESAWTAQSMTAFDEAFQAAAALGVSICVASGDNGSSDGVTDGASHVDFPASSPHALACGGTSLQASAGKATSETVWNDGAKGGAGGGGVSAFFAVPAWQRGLVATTTGHAKTALTMRGVPDVAAVADPQTGYDVRVDGHDAVFGGTSAVAPLWAGLIARINGARGTSIGFFQPKLYQSPTALKDILQGNNGAFAASAGWDACTGLGSPDGKKVAGAV